MVVNPKDGIICRDCRDAFVSTGSCVCKKCGKPLYGSTDEYCSDCERRGHIFAGNFAMWLYDSKMQSSIANFKYHGRREYAGYYAKEISRRFGRQILALSIDAVVPVPLYIKKKKVRGYNQAEVFAKELGRLLGLRVYPKLILRIKNTRPQKELDDLQRSRNLRDAFIYNEKWVRRQKELPDIKRVLLTDDIYTTGSTLDACSRTLMENGISEVYGLTISIGKGADIGNL